MNHPLLPGFEDDAVLFALADGALDELTAARVHGALSQRPDLLVEYDRIRSLMGRLASDLPPAPSRLDAERIETVLTTAARTPSWRFRWWRPRVFVGLAVAALVIVTISTNLGERRIARYEDPPAVRVAPLQSAGNYAYAPAPLQAEAAEQSTREINGLDGTILAQTGKEQDKVGDYRTLSEKPRWKIEANPDNGARAIDGRPRAVTDLPRQDANVNALNENFMDQSRQRMGELNHIAQSERVRTFNLNLKTAEADDDLNAEVGPNKTTTATIDRVDVFRSTSGEKAKTGWADQSRSAIDIVDLSGKLAAIRSELSKEKEGESDATLESDQSDPKGREEAVAASEGGAMFLMRVAKKQARRTEAPAEPAQEVMASKRPQAPAVQPPTRPQGSMTNGEGGGFNVFGGGGAGGAAPVGGAADKDGKSAASEIQSRPFNYFVPHQGPAARFSAPADAPEPPITLWNGQQGHALQWQGTALGSVTVDGYADHGRKVVSNGAILIDQRRPALPAKALAALLAAPARAISGPAVVAEDAILPVEVEPAAAAAWQTATARLSAESGPSRGRMLVAAAYAAGVQARLTGGRLVIGQPRPLDASDTGGLDAAQFTAAFGVTPAIDTSRDARHTVALDAGTASYDRAVAEAAQGRRIAADAVQVEHFVNAVPFAWPRAAPGAAEAFTVSAEAGPSPFAARTTLVAVGVMGNPAEPGQRRPLHLTLAVDASGSMATPAGLSRVRRGFAELLDHLGPDDRVAVVAFADRASLVLPATPASQRGRIDAALAGITPGGATNAGDGLTLAYQVAAESALPGAVSRIVFATDGATLAADADETLARVKSWHGRGLSLLVLSVGTPTGTVLDRLAQAGDGERVDLPSDAAAVAVFRDRLLPERLGVLGRDAKLQVIWNPARVLRARLVGFEQKRLAHRDFRDNSVQAGQLAEDARATALFEVTLAPDVGGPLGEARVRYHDTRLDAVRELVCPLPGSLVAGSASLRLRTAACASEVGEILAASWWANLRASQPAQVAGELRRIQAANDDPVLGACIDRLLSLTALPVTAP